jgi:hypothetical protein
LLHATLRNLQRGQQITGGASRRGAVDAANSAKPQRSGMRKRVAVHCGPRGDAAVDAGGNPAANRRVRGAAVGLATCLLQAVAGPDDLAVDQHLDALERQRGCDAEGPRRRGLRRADHAAWFDRANAKLQQRTVGDEASAGLESGEVAFHRDRLRYLHVYARRADGHRAEEIHHGIGAC